MQKVAKLLSIESLLLRKARTKRGVDEDKNEEDGDAAPAKRRRRRRRTQAEQDVPDQQDPHLVVGGQTPADENDVDENPTENDGEVEQDRRRKELRLVCTTALRK